MSKRKLWNKLTKMNGGKSKSKNYDVAETLNDLIEVIAEELLATNNQRSDTLQVIDDEAHKLMLKMKTKRDKAWDKEDAKAK